MNGATAEPWLKIIKPPNKTKTKIIGSNQYFFLIFKKFQNSIKKSISKLIIHIIVTIIFLDPVSFIFIKF